MPPRATHLRVGWRTDIQWDLTAYRVPSIFGHGDVETRLNLRVTLPQGVGWATQVRSAQVTCNETVFRDHVDRVVADLVVQATYGFAEVLSQQLRDAIQEHDL